MLSTHEQIIVDMLQDLDVPDLVLLSTVIEPARRDFEAIARNIEGSNVKVSWRQNEDPKCLPTFEKEIACHERNHEEQDATMSHSGDLQDHEVTDDGYGEEDAENQNVDTTDDAWKMHEIACQRCCLIHKKPWMSSLLKRKVDDKQIKST
jgi:hypothetical protein